MIGPNNWQGCAFPSLSVHPPLQDGWSGLSDVVTQELVVAPMQPQAMYPPVDPFGLMRIMPLFLPPGPCTSLKLAPGANLKASGATTS